MLDLVADVPNYGNFLPWVKAVKVWNFDNLPNSFDAELLIGYRNFRAPFSTGVIIDKTGQKILTQLLKPKSKIRALFSQPMRALDCQWVFRPNGDGCTIDLKIEYEFNDKIFSALLSNNIEKASQKLIEAFTNEAKRRYS